MFIYIFYDSKQKTYSITLCLIIVAHRSTTRTELTHIDVAAYIKIPAVFVNLIRLF